MALVPPRQTPWHSTLGRRCSRKPSDPPFHRRGSRVLEGKYQSYLDIWIAIFSLPQKPFQKRVGVAETRGMSLQRTRLR